MLYDLNVPWTPTTLPTEISRTLSFLSTLGYTTIALNHLLTGPVPSKIINPLILPPPGVTIPKDTTLLTRCTLTITDPSHNHRLKDHSAAYQIVALRPINQASFERACLSYPDYSILSLDLTQRYQFHFKQKTLMTAVNRGIRIELCYAQLTSGDSNQRRNVIANVISIIRATKGRGLLVGSEARGVLGVRAPADVGNLLEVWGLAKEKANEAMGVNCRAVVVNEGLKRSSYRGVVDVIEGGEAYVPVATDKDKGKEKQMNTIGKGKRKAEDENPDGTPKISKREAKRLKQAARKAEREAEASSPAQVTPSATTESSQEPKTPSTTKLKAKN